MLFLSLNDLWKKRVAPIKVQEERAESFQGLLIDCLQNRQEVRWFRSVLRNHWLHLNQREGILLPKSLLNHSFWFSLKFFQRFYFKWVFVLGVFTRGVVWHINSLFIGWNDILGGTDFGNNSSPFLCKWGLNFIKRHWICCADLQMAMWRISIISTPTDFIFGQNIKTMFGREQLFGEGSGCSEQSNWFIKDFLKELKWMRLVMS